VNVIYVFFCLATIALLSYKSKSEFLTDDYGVQREYVAPFGCVEGRDRSERGTEWVGGGRDEELLLQGLLAHAPGLARAKKMPVCGRSGQAGVGGGTSGASARAKRARRRGVLLRERSELDEGVSFCGGSGRAGTPLTPLAAGEVGPGARLLSRF
jgi:hypothetical protein